MFAAIGNGVVRSRHSGGGRRSLPALGGPVEGGESRIEYKKQSFEVPLEIARRFRDVKYKTLVGLSSLVPVAWYTVDDQLFLWDFKRDGITTIQCDGVITAVSIGISAVILNFQKNLKFIIAVCTENTVSLIGLDDSLKQIQLDGYFLTIPIVFNTVGITATGRIFLSSLH